MLRSYRRYTRSSTGNSYEDNNIIEIMLYYTHMYTTNNIAAYTILEDRSNLPMDKQ